MGDEPVVNNNAATNEEVIEFVRGMGEMLRWLTFYGGFLSGAIAQRDGKFNIETAHAKYKELGDLPERPDERAR